MRSVAVIAVVKNFSVRCEFKPNFLEHFQVLFTPHTGVSRLVILHLFRFCLATL